MSTEPATPSAAPESPAPKASRAGRDLPAAILVGVALVAAVVASLFLLKVAFLALVLLAGLLGIWELSNALATNGTKVPVVPVVLGGVLLLVGAYYDGVEAVALATALTVLATLVWRLPDGAEGFVRDVTAGIFTLAYVPVLGSFVLLMVSESDGAWRILAFLGCTVASDTGGYVAGVLKGRHPMAPTISPKKSWEGFAGSLVAGTVAGVLLVVLGLEGRWWVGVLLGVAAVVAATLGDLCESLIKRDLGIKDMGNLLPGHGGVMDRLDSLLAVAPVAWVVLHYLVSVQR